MPIKASPLEDADSFSRLYERAHIIIFRYIFGLQGGPAEEVEDITAETFLNAWKARRQFTGDDNAALGWLLHIARNLVIDSYRRRKAQYKLAIDDPDIEWLNIPEGFSSPELQIEYRQQFSRLWELIQDLSIEQRDLLILRYVVGWRVNQIADHLHIPENTVSVQIRRILNRLKARWTQEQEN